MPERLSRDDELKLAACAYVDEHNEVERARKEYDEAMKRHEERSLKLAACKDRLMSFVGPAQRQKHVVAGGKLVTVTHERGVDVDDVLVATT